MFTKIVQNKLAFPDKKKLKINSETKDIISKMLEKDNKKRLGAKNGMDDVINHPYFKNFEFDKLMKKDLEPPYLPNIDGNENKYFEKNNFNDDGFLN